MTPNGTAAFDAREELIRVKGQASETLNVRETRHVLSTISVIRGDLPPARAVRGLA